MDVLKSIRGSCQSCGTFRYRSSFEDKAEHGSIDRSICKRLVSFTVYFYVLTIRHADQMYHASLCTVTYTLIARTACQRHVGSPESKTKALLGWKIYLVLFFKFIQTMTNSSKLYKFKEMLHNFSLIITLNKTVLKGGV